MPGTVDSVQTEGEANVLELGRNSRAANEKVNDSLILEGRNVYTICLRYRGHSR